MLYVFLVSPWFDHNALMHHTMHVLDALFIAIAPNRQEIVGSVRILQNAYL